MRAPRALERLRRLLPCAGYRFRRPLVCLHSDDWGLAGIRDREGAEELRRAGFKAGGLGFGSYTLETAADVERLCAVLERRRDSLGGRPCLTALHVTSNVEFSLAGGAPPLPLRPVARGVPVPWRRPGLVEAYREARRRGLWRPGLHGLTHFSVRAAEEALSGDAGPALRRLHAAGTPMLYEGGPDLGHEYRDRRGWLAYEDQRDLVESAAGAFKELFGERPLSACAPGYRANGDTRLAWAAAGIRVAHLGPGAARGPFLDHSGLLILPRTLSFEPALGAGPGLEDAVRLCRRSAAAGLPVVISIHSVNFHSTLRDHLGPSLEALNVLLGRLERELEGMLYVGDAEILQAALEGRLRRGGVEVDPGVSRRLQPPESGAPPWRSRRKAER